MSIKIENLITLLNKIDLYFFQIWHIELQDSGTVKVEFVADLQRHQKAVNVVRFSPSSEFLASGDDGIFFLSFIELYHC